MPLATLGDVTIFYETTGDRADPTLVLVNGLGSQCLEWDPALRRMFADRGFHVVVFDNRDVGLSTHVDVAVDMAAVMAGDDSGVPYQLSDMAGDVVGLLDHLGVDRAHVLGMSLGGVIAQVVAIEHPDRVLTLTSIMSTTGEPGVGAPSAEAFAALVAPSPSTREEAQDRRVARARIWASPAHIDEARLRRLAGAAWDRDHDVTGPSRQMAAVVASDSRAEGLAALDVPTLVVHGTADPLVHLSGGERTAELVPDAKLLIVEGMGHDLPPALWPEVVDAVTAHAAAHPPTRPPDP